MFGTHINNHQTTNIFAPSALIGYTGFVGSNLARQFEFDHLYNSKNIGDIVGHDYDLIVCAGMPGTKWLANQNPENDWSSISQLINSLKGVSTRRFVLASTVDVYPIPNNVDEITSINPDQCHPYGLHRFKLEQFVRTQFPEVTVIRLPALFGEGLKKNAIFDLMHSHRLEVLHPDSRFQFYFLDRLWSDISKALDHHLRLVNFATQPVRLGDIADTLFSIKLKTPANPVADYNFTSIHAPTFGGSLGYFLSSDQVISDLKAFIQKS